MTSKKTVQGLAMVSRAEADAWLKAQGTPSELTTR
jgi:hypothetical protein